MDGLVWRFRDGFIYMLDTLVGMAGRLDLAGWAPLAFHDFPETSWSCTLSLQQSSLSFYMVSVKEFVNIE